MVNLFWLIPHRFFHNAIAWPELNFIFKPRFLLLLLLLLLILIKSASFIDWRFLQTVSVCVCVNRNLRPFECSLHYNTVYLQAHVWDGGRLVWLEVKPDFRIRVCFLFSGSTEPPKNNGSCSNSCCTSSEYSCNPEGCYCDSWCERNDNCCDDYADVCPTLVRRGIMSAFFLLACILLPSTRGNFTIYF